MNDPFADLLSPPQPAQQNMPPNPNNGFRTNGQQPSIAPSMGAMGKPNPFNTTTMANALPQRPNPTVQVNNSAFDPLAGFGASNMQRGPISPGMLTGPISPPASGFPMSPVVSVGSPMMQPSPVMMSPTQTASHSQLLPPSAPVNDMESIFGISSPRPGAQAPAPGGLPLSPTAGAGKSEALQKRMASTTKTQESARLGVNFAAFAASPAAPGSSIKPAAPTISQPQSPATNSQNIFGSTTSSGSSGSQNAPQQTVQTPSAADSFQKAGSRDSGAESDDSDDEEHESNHGGSSSDFHGAIESSVNSDRFANPDEGEDTEFRFSVGENAVKSIQENEYNAVFEEGVKLGVLMEKVDQWDEKKKGRSEQAVVKLVVEGGAADNAGVLVGSIVIAVNERDVSKDSYNDILDMLRTAPRPLTVRFAKQKVNEDPSVQGEILSRVSNGTFSVGNFKSGRAQWVSKYYAFGGAEADILQLFVSRQKYHECVIALYENRQVTTQIHTFRLSRDHQCGRIKNKMYKNFGHLYYFSLKVPSLRFIPAKFASRDPNQLRALHTRIVKIIDQKRRECAQAIATGGVY